MTIKRVLSMTMTVLLSLAIITPSAHAAFSDVPSDAWYRSDVDDVQKYGIIQGVGDNRFSPNGTLTLAEAITMATRAYAWENKISIPEGGSPWYQVYLDSADANRICLYGEFGTNYTDPCDRQTMAKLFYRVIPSETRNTINTVKTIPDVPDTADNAPIYSLYAMGILTGSDSRGTFDPNRTITRAETAAILNRVLEPSKRKKITIQPAVSSSDAYKEFLQSKGYRSVTDAWDNPPMSYCKIDVNKDGIQELFLFGPDAIGHVNTAAYGFDQANGKVFLIKWKELNVETGTWQTLDSVYSNNGWIPLGYSSSTGYLHRSAGHNTAMFGDDVLYKLQDGVLQNQCIVTWMCNDLDEFTLTYTLYTSSNPKGKTISEEEAVSYMEEDALQWPEEIDVP